MTTFNRKARVDAMYNALSTCGIGLMLVVVGAAILVELLHLQSIFWVLRHLWNVPI